MISYIFLFIAGLLLVAYCFGKLKKNRYDLAARTVINNFDHYSTSIYMEQANNKVLSRNSMELGKKTKQEFITLLSAKSFIDCTCVSIHMLITKKNYSLNDKIYILKIIKNNPDLLKKLYNDYLITVSKVRVNKELYIYDNVSSIDKISRDKFYELMNAEIYSDF